MINVHVLLTMLFVSVSLCSPMAYADGNLQMDGTLVTEPCTLDPGLNTITVSFGTVIKKGLYREPRSSVQTFKVSLSDCDVSLGHDVTLTFTGEESQAEGMSGYLATTGPGSTGIVIGIETQDGSAVAINEPTPAFKLHDGLSEIYFQAYVLATPEAVRNQSLAAGDFSATATLDIDYP